MSYFSIDVSSAHYFIQTLSVYITTTVFGVQFSTKLFVAKLRWINLTRNYCVTTAKAKYLSHSNWQALLTPSKVPASLAVVRNASHCTEFNLDNFPLHPCHVKSNTADCPYMVR